MKTKINNKFVIEDRYDVVTNSPYFDIYENSDEETYGEWIGDMDFYDLLEEGLIDIDGNLDIDGIDEYITETFS